MNNNEKSIALRSLTHSVKARRLLAEYGISSRVIKPDAAKSEKGCGYGVAVAVAEAEEAVRVLEANGIPTAEAPR